MVNVVSPDCLVIIPAYNAEKTIKKALNSLELERTWKHTISVVVVDDGSNDLTSDYLTELAIRFPNVEIVSKRNSGVSATRNIGMKIERGRYVYFMDADDEVIRDTLEKLLSIMDETGVDIVVADYLRINVDTGEKELQHSFQSFKQGFIDRADIETGLLPKIFCNTLNGFSCLYNKVYKRSFINRSKAIFDVKRPHGEDWMFNLKIFDVAQSIYVSDYILYNYYIDSSTKLSKYGIRGSYGVLSGIEFKMTMCNRYKLFDELSVEYATYVFAKAETLMAIFRKSSLSEKKELLDNKTFRYVMGYMNRFSKEILPLKTYCKKDDIFYFLARYGSRICLLYSFL